MGISGISPLSLLLILVIVLVLFGAKRLRNVGRDVGAAVKGFKEEVDKPVKSPPNKRNLD